MTTTYIPLDAVESAALKDPDTLLPKAIYERLSKFIDDAVKSLPCHQKELNDSRSHKAISIDGERGTGKTSVLVNLKDYLLLKNKELLESIHILDPIDPTLLEDGESLFLHVIVAAVLQDKNVKLAQVSCADKSRYFNQCLEKLAHGLESVELQQQQRGMDKIRSLYGNKHLADCVEAFFQATLKLLGKKLLVLPIDDVDTSLNRAFENLEIIRRYLTTPCVLPIVSGDRRLYNEVCWRDFHGRLNKDSTYRRQQAYEIAKDLALEYQRKILPLPRRLSMPAVSEYWQKKDITLNKGGMPLQNFMAWLDIFVTGPVNGLENSALPLPIPSIRALTQLINHCGDLISGLPSNIRDASTVLAVRRVWQMPTVPLTILESFQNKHQELGKERRRDYSDAYQIFSGEVARYKAIDYLPLGTKNNGEVITTSNLISNWVKRLADYFRFEPKAGAVYMILLARLDWEHWKKTKHRQRSILATPLFQPLLHESPELALFEKSDDLSDWERRLKSRLPEGWIAGIKNQQTVLPYPVAEVGINAALNWAYWEDVRSYNIEKEKEDKAIFLISLLTQRNFYTNAKQSMMLNIGRVFELLIVSLISPLELSDLQRIRQRAPFFSTSELAPTKTLDIEEEQQPSNRNRKETQTEASKDMPEEILDEIDKHWQKLHEEIAEWREQYHVDELNISPWMVYKVFNKVYSQVASSLNVPNGMKDTTDAITIAGKVFYAAWSAFGSFEKGELFGLPDVVATTNINSLKNFESNEHYRVNIGPFSPTKTQIMSADTSTYIARKTYGEQTRTVTYVLVEHPLRKWIDEFSDYIPSNKPTAIPQGESSKKPSPKEIITSRLKINNSGRLTEKSIYFAMVNNIFSKEDFDILLNTFLNENSGHANKYPIKQYINAGKRYFKNGDE